MANFPGNSRAITWMLGAFLVILCSLTILNLYLLLDTREESEPKEEEEEVKVEPKMPIFVAVGPMTVNLGTDAYGQRLLYAGLSLRVRDEETREQIETHMPEVHSRLLVLLSGREADELTGPGSKEKLAAEILTIFEQPLAEGWPPPAVDAVLFTDFIVQ